MGSARRSQDFFPHLQRSSIAARAMMADPSPQPCSSADPATPRSSERFLRLSRLAGLRRTPDSLQAEETHSIRRNPSPTCGRPRKGSVDRGGLHPCTQRQIETRAIRQEPGDIAILARTNYQVDRLADEVTRDSAVTHACSTTPGVCSSSGQRSSRPIGCSVYCSNPGTMPS